MRGIDGKTEILLFFMNDSLSEAFSRHFLESVVQLTSIVTIGGSESVLVNLSSRNFETNELEHTVCEWDTQSGQIRRTLSGTVAAVFLDGERILLEHNGQILLHNRSGHLTEHLFDLKIGHYFTGHLSLYGVALSPNEKKVAFLKEVAAIACLSDTNVLEVENLLCKTKGGRNRPGFWNGKYNQLWIFDLETRSQYPLTWVDREVHSFSWSPDSSSLCFISNLTETPDCNHRNSLCLVDCRTHAISVLSTGEGSCYQPVWSPSGNTIAYLHTQSEYTSKDSCMEDTGLCLIRPEGGEIVRVGDEMDRKIECVKWSPNGSELYFLVGDHGRTTVFKYNREGNLNIALSGSRIIKDFAFVNHEKDILIISSDPDTPDEVFRYCIASGKIENRSNFNQLASREFASSRCEELLFTGSDGLKLQGWILFPAHWDKEKSYPLALVIHGGPHNMFGYEYNEKIKFLSLNGFAVFFMNPRGSHGYGQQFTSGTHRDWGGGDYRDLMDGIQNVLARYQWIDKEKRVVYGQSYGGYMTNWIITQTRAFKCVVSDGGISNLISFSGQSLYHLLMEAEFGKLWQNFDLLWERSPLKYSEQVSTPILFLHGEADNEVPVGQSDEMYTLLYKLGVKTRMVRFLEEGHSWRPDLKPRSHLKVLTEMLNWFCDNLK